VSVAEIVRRPAPALTEFIASVFVGLGADEPIAREVAQHLVRASLSGHDSHGILRAAHYVRHADVGNLQPRARPVIVREGATGAVIDAQYCFGIHSTGVALDWALTAARKHGLGAAAVRHSSHIGRLGEYSERATSQGMIAIVTVGYAGPGLGGVVPFGGKHQFLGTNPWSFGIPSESGTPMIFDAATSSIPEGKVVLAHAKGEQLPPGTIVDKDGNPSTDPQDHFDGGALLPLGGEQFGHKGFGLALAAALVSGLAIIDDPEPSIPAGLGKAPKRPGVMAGVFLLAIDPGIFGPRERYARLVADNLTALRAQEPAKGYNAVMAPGEIEARTRAQRERDGIEIPAKTWAGLLELGQRFGVAPP
jgi:hydroxycarboxylate dehydrogenase B